MQRRDFLKGGVALAVAAELGTNKPKSHLLSRAATISCRVLRLSIWSSELNLKDPRIAAKAVSPALSRAAFAQSKSSLGCLHMRQDLFLDRSVLDLFGIPHSRYGFQ
jgi:hypothetical protein